MTAEAVAANDVEVEFVADESFVIPYAVVLAVGTVEVVADPDEGVSVVTHVLLDGPYAPDNVYVVFVSDPGIPKSVISVLVTAVASLT